MNKKILHLTGSISRQAGGPYESIRHLALNLSRDSDIFVLGLYDLHIDQDRNTWLPIVPSTCKSIVFHRFGFSPSMHKKVRQAKADLIHLHGIWMYTSLVTFIYCKKNKIPYIVSPRGMLEPWAFNHNSWKKKPIWYAWEKHILKNSFLLHATSRKEATNLRKLGFKNKIVNIPNGVEVPNIDIVKHEKKNKTAVFLSRIHPKKGLINLINAWSIIRPSDWKLIICGPDECNHKTDVSRLIKKHSLTDSITLYDPVYGARKLEVLSNTDLFILPSFSENFGIVVAEALSHRIPVITTKGTPWAELDTHNCGWWIDIGVEPLAEAIKEATLLPLEQLREMGQRGRRLVERNYSWDKIGEEFLTVYEWVFNGGIQPDCVINE